eukprot:7130675-Pyramimonas_sp.AAC.1
MGNGRPSDGKERGLRTLLPAAGFVPTAGRFSRCRGASGTGRHREEQLRQVRVVSIGGDPAAGVQR